MKRLLIIALLLQVSGAVAGDWIVQPKPDGSMRLFQEGMADVASADTLTLRQPANKALGVQVSPVGQGRCEKGDLAIGSLRFPLQTLQGGKQVGCGEFVSWSPASKDKLAGLRSVNRSFKGDRLLTRGALPPRIHFGNITFSLEGEKGPTVFPVWLDLTALQDEIVTLEAAFSKSAFSLGSVSELSDKTALAQLRIAKTRQSGEAPLPYILRFESIQQRDNNYYLMTADGQIAIPYHINVAGKEILPDTEHHGTIPSGPVVSIVVDVEVLLEGKSTQGLAANTRLADMLTAVITPDS